MRWWIESIAIGISFTALALTAGCGGDEDPPDLARYFQAEPYLNSPKCSTVDGQLTGRREMRLYRAGRGDLAGCSQGLQRYYLRHSLQFFTAAPEEEISLPYAVDNRGYALEKALLEQFPGVDLNDEAALMKDPVLWASIERFAVNFMLRPMIDFARTHSQSGQKVTNMVVVSELFAANVASTENVLGLAISVPLLTAQQVEEPGSFNWKDSDLPPDFSPMFFLHGRATNELLVKIGRQARDITVAHEFGHTAGLVHEVGTDDEDNLMYPRVRQSSDCDDGLYPEQLALMRQTLGVGPAPETVVARVVRPEADDPRPRTPLRPGDLRALLDGDVTPLRRLLHLHSR